MKLRLSRLIRQMLTGKFVYGTALFLGAMSALAFAPTFYWPLWLISFSTFGWMLAAIPKGRQAFWLGFAFGYGHFGVGLYWIANALLTDPERYAWMLPFSWFGIPLIAAPFIAVPAWLACYTKWRIPSFVMLFLFAEWLRGEGWVDFPWNQAGYVWMVDEVAFQSAVHITIYGLSFLALLAGFLPYWLIKKKHAFTAVALVCIMVHLGYGVQRLMNAPEAKWPTHFPSTLIVQANTPVVMPGDVQGALKALEAHMELSKNTDAKLIVWPESGSHFALNQEPDLRREIAKIIPKGSYLATGSLHINEQDGRYYNSMSLLNHKGELVAEYYKHMLVPFGEYIPFQKVIPFLDTFTGGGEGFSRGPGPQAFQLEGLPPLMPLICYEAIFPFEAMVGNHHKDTILLNITNDVWFGNSSGPYQHLQMARLRAVERERILVRAANTGMSLVVDAYGRLIHKKALNTAGTIVAN